MKAVHEVVPPDLTSHRVWEFADDKDAELPDETSMRLLEESPVGSLSGRLASAYARQQQALPRRTKQTKKTSSLAGGGPMAV
jgi:hypothetical protein